MSDQEPDQITCATYTHARRHPMVLGQIGGWTPPFQLTIPQIVVLVVVIWLEYQTWGWWLGYLPASLAIVVAIALPCLLAWGARRARLEGRSLARTAGGWLSLLTVPKTGRVQGRANRPAGPVGLGRACVFVAPGPPELAPGASSALPRKGGER